MKKATKNQTEIESEIQVNEIAIESEPTEPTATEPTEQQPTEPTEPTEQPTEPTEQQPTEPTPEAQKKKRGRPKKSETNSEATAQKNSNEIENDIFASEKDFEQHKTEENKEKQQQQQQQKTIFNISGEMLLGAIDFTAPLLINFVGGAIEPELKKVPAQQFMLAEEERKTLLPAAEAVARENVKLSPVEMLLGGLLIVYTGKIYQAINEIRAKK
jgi:hypothetical protein